MTPRTKLNIWLSLSLVGMLSAFVWVQSITSTNNAPQGLISRVPADFAAVVKGDKDRSSKWPTFRKHVLEKHPFCAYCGGTEKLQVHHIAPFHLHPELELDETNVIVLCEKPETDHHLHIGHLGNFRSEGNPNVVEDCKKNEVKLRKLGTWGK